MTENGQPPAKFSLYENVCCRSNRPALAAICGQRVGIIGRTFVEHKGWSYEVAGSKASPTFRCFEDELALTPPESLVPESELFAAIVEQTALLRYSVASQGLRALLHERGLDPMRCVLITCEQGDDVYVLFVLPDGSAVVADYREHFHTRQALKFVSWQIAAGRDRLCELGKRIVAGDFPSFDAQVKEFFETQLAAEDCVLPPLNWGDRLWHIWEQPE